MSDGGGTAPLSSVNVTWIQRQYLALGWLGSGHLAGDQDGKWEEELPNTPVSLGSFPPWDGPSVWLSIWRFFPDIWSSKLLDLVAIDTIIVAMT